MALAYHPFHLAQSMSERQAQASGLRALRVAPRDGVRDPSRE